ncbi:MAG: transcriptional regulator [Ornithinibacter sp.]
MTSARPDAELDPVIHAPARLRIMATLSAVPERDAISFTRLQQLLDLTAGNLTTHLRRLEDAAYVQVWRSGSGRSARTTAALTTRGRLALSAYREALTAILG